LRARGAPNPGGAAQPSYSSTTASTRPRSTRWLQKAPDPFSELSLLQAGSSLPLTPKLVHLLLRLLTVGILPEREDLGDRSIIPHSAFHIPHWVAGISPRCAPLVQVFAQIVLREYGTLWLRGACRHRPDAYLPDLGFPCHLTAIGHMCLTHRVANRRGPGAVRESESSEWRAPHLGAGSFVLSADPHPQVRSSGEDDAQVSFAVASGSLLSECFSVSYSSASLTLVCLVRVRRERCYRHPRYPRHPTGQRGCRRRRPSSGRACREHRHKLLPAAETACAALRSSVRDGCFELHTGKEVEKLAEHAAESVHG
jgi:hypothetical protein